MSNFRYKCDCECNCCDGMSLCSIIGLIISIFIGFGLGIAAFLGIFAATTVAFIGLLLAIGAIVLTVIVVLLDNTPLKRRCLCRNLALLIVGIIGTILSALIILATAPLLSIFLSGIFVGITSIFSLLVVTSFICLIICVANCDN